jgi:O-antigen ligase
MICFLPLYLLKIKYDKNVSYLNYLILILGIYCIFISGMRSAYLCVVALFFMLFWDDIFKKIRLQLFFVVFFLIGLFMVLGRGELIDNLLDKRGVEYGTEISGTQEMFESRNKLASPSLNNFRDNPFFGIGFGVPTNATQPEFDLFNVWGLKYLPGTNVIISYPTEKGVLYTLLLEELGVIGFLLFLIIICNAFFFKLNHNFLLLTPILVLSLSEAGLFSLNGIGIFGFIVLLLSVLSYNQWPNIFKYY